LAPRLGSRLRRSTFPPQLRLLDPPMTPQYMYIILDQFLCDFVFVKCRKYLLCIVKCCSLQYSLLSCSDNCKLTAADTDIKTEGYRIAAKV